MMQASKPNHDITLNNVTKIFISCFINLILFLIIGIGLLAIPQGYVLPIGFFENSYASILINFILFYFLTYFLSTVISLYPTYIMRLLFEPHFDKENIYSIRKFGLMIYDIKSKNSSDQSCESTQAPQKVDKKSIASTNVNTEKKSFESLFKNARVNQGNIFIALWSFALAQIMLSFSIYGDHSHFDSLFIYNILLAGVILISHYCLLVLIRKKYVKEKEKFCKNNKDANFNKIYKISILTLLVVIPLFSLIVHSAGWGWLSVILFYFLNFLVSGIFIFTRFARKGITWISTPTSFINFLRFKGLTILTLLIASLFFPYKLQFINPINILLIGLIFIYTALAFGVKFFAVLKNWDFQRVENNPNCYKHVNKLTFLAFLVGSIIWSFTTNTNNIHKLEHKLSNKKISYEGYLNALSLNSNVDCPILYAAYGGGLKAHHWNNLLLNDIKIKHPQIFENTIAMSGVSGGSMGIATSALLDRDNNKRSVEIIDKISTSNVLSNELNHLFIWDLLRENLPGVFARGKGRSQRSMSFFAHKIFKDKALISDISIHELYHDLIKEKGFYPMLLFNSTANRNKYGICSSVYFGPEKKDFIFPNAINVAEHDGHRSLSFYDAVSTSNRFPIVSPSAYIPPKGIFVDGGYYENSGLLSLISLYESLKEKECFPNQHFILISVTNSKENYLEYLLEKCQQKETLKVDHDKMEILSMFSSIGNLERKPDYFRSMLKKYRKGEIYVMNIDLPHFLNMADVNNYFNGEVTESFKQEIRNIIDDSNENISNYLQISEYNEEQFGNINPPTSRYLSQPTVDYMNCMIEYPTVQSQIHAIIQKMKLCDTY